MLKVNALLAVKANTRLVLATELVARNADIEAMRMELSVAKLSHLAAVRHIPKPVVTRILWQRPAHMEAARQEAMATGCVVRL